MSFGEGALLRRSFSSSISPSFCGSPPIPFKAPGLVSTVAARKDPSEEVLVLP